MDPSQIEKHLPTLYPLGKRIVKTVNGAAVVPRDRKLIIECALETGFQIGLNVLMMLAMISGIKAISDHEIPLGWKLLLYGATQYGTGTVILKYGLRQEKEDAKRLDAKIAAADQEIAELKARLSETENV
jgi:hypothetical protein